MDYCQTSSVDQNILKEVLAKVELLLWEHHPNISSWNSNNDLTKFFDLFVHGSMGIRSLILKYLLCATHGTYKQTR